jgi:PQQ-dependent catabolism-associated CXXCW motif protein
MMLVAWLLLASISPADDAASFDPATGYRIAHYRGVVPAAPEGVGRIGIDAVAKSARDGAILIDVTPAEGGMRDAAFGRWRLAAPHASIPGAHWFPEAGRGTLANGIEPWFLGGVQRLAGRHRGKPLVVFCLADCWMSWNAAMRLHRAGHPDVLWFAEGIDGWREAGKRLKNIGPQ